MKIAGYDTHPAADLFPMLSSKELAELAADIEQHGQLHPIILHEDKILDGRNRARACEFLNREPVVEEWDGSGGDPVSYVVSANLRRRHLDESQRGMIGARAREMFEEDARERQKGGRGGKLLSANSREATGKSAEKAASLAKVSPRTVEAGSTVLRHGVSELIAAVDGGAVAVSTAALIAEEPKQRQREIVARGEKEILAEAKKIRERKQADRRNKRLEKIAEISDGNQPLTTQGGAGPWPVIYADPPWRYEHAESDSRAIENHYPTMDLDEICALDVRSMATDDAILFIWATSPKLAESMRVVEAWGFTYRTCMVWVKDKIGMGYYARQRHELLLICTRGEIPVPPPEARPDSVVEAERTVHSRKPALFAELIERMYPTLPRVELFCRQPRAGWSVWGNQSRGKAA